MKWYTVACHKSHVRVNVSKDNEGIVLRSHMSNILLNGKYERNANYCPGNIVLNLSNVYESYVYNKIISRNSRVFY